MKQLQRGFSFMEVLICMLVLTTGLVILARFQITLANSETLGKQRLEAVNLAQAKLEALRNFQVLNTTTGNFAYQDIISGSETITNNSAIYTRSWNVVTNNIPAYKTVTVTVSWTDHNNSAQTVILSSVIGASDPAKSGQLTK